MRSQSIDLMSDKTLDQRYYRLLLVLSSLEPLKIKILQVLAHLSPNRISASELTILLGYSKSARTIYRGVLEELEQDGFIVLEKLTPKLFSIQIANQHPLMNTLVELAIEYGESYSQQLHQALEERKSHE